MEEHTAIHEAGHAVIARVLGLACGTVTIESDSDSAGHAIVGDPWATISAWDRQLWAQVESGAYPLKSYSERAAFRGNIIAKMAGAEAEVVLLGHCSGGDDDDRLQIDLMAASDNSELSDDQWERYEPRMRRQARRLIRKHRPAIERVASALLERRTLTKGDIDALI